MLPIGSIVYLKEGSRKLMVLNRGTLLEQYDKAAKVGKSLISGSKNFINSSSKRAIRFIENIGASIKVHKIPLIGGT